MKHLWWQWLTRVNHRVLPMIYKQGKLVGLSPASMAILGYKRWVLFQLMKHENPADRWQRNQK
jgi:hypothetical protein